MSKAKHTPGPWKTRESWCGNGVEIYAHDPAIKKPCIPTELASVDDSHDEWKANTTRIVTCVNAMEGLTNAQVAGLRKSHAELVAEMSKLADDAEQAAFEEWLIRVCPSGDVDSVQQQWDGSSDFADFAEKWKVARAALATAKEAV